MMKKQTNRRRPARQSAKRFKFSPAHVSQQRFLQTTTVYVMHNIPVFYLNKFGISDNTDARRKTVSDTTTGYVFYLLSPKLEFGWHLEQFIHHLYRFQNVHFLTGSGRTEWFVVFSPVVGISTMFLCHFYGWEFTWKQHCLFFFCPFVWLDGWFWLAVFALARLIAYITVFLLIAWLLAHQ